MNKGKGKLHPDMQIVETCKYMTWDLWTYLAQPTWFLDLVSIKMRLESEYSNKQQKDADRKLKSSNRR